MPRVILMRHAKAEPPDGWADDAARPLAPRGRADAAVTAGLLADLGLAPDLALVSTAVRTRETWAIVAEALPAREVAFEEGLYLAAPDVMANRVAAAWAAGAETVILVAHNPGLADLAARWSSGPGPQAADAAERLALGFPTAVAAVFGCDAPDLTSPLRAEAVVGPVKAPKAAD